MEIFDREKIKKLLKEKGMNYISLSKNSQIPLGTIRNIMAGIVKNPRLDTIEAIYKALGLIDEQQIKESAQSEIMSIFETLNEEQKDAVLNIAKQLKNRK